MSAREPPSHDSSSGEETFVFERWPSERPASNARSTIPVGFIGVVQWGLLAVFAVSIGFGASRVRHAVSLVGNAYECVFESSRGVALERQQLAARDAAVGAPVREPPRDASAKGGEVREPRALALSHGQARVGDASTAEAPEAALDFGDDQRERLKAHLEEGRRKLRQRQLDAAEQAFRRALAIRSGHPWAFSGLANVHLLRGEIDLAIALAEKAVNAAPYQAPYHVVLGDILRIAGDLQRAEAEYQRASQLNPSKPVDGAARSLPENPF